MLHLVWARVLENGVVPPVGRWGVWIHVYKERMSEKIPFSNGIMFGVLKGFFCCCLYQHE